MRWILSVFVAFLLGCSGRLPAPAPREILVDPTPAVLALSDSILAAAADRDAARFAGYFSDRPGFRYFINKRGMESREVLRTTFEAVLKRQEFFRPAWQSRSVQVLTPEIAILTGTFATRARRLNGEDWTADGVVTFVAYMDRDGWRVVNWHTSE